MKRMGKPKVYQWVCALPSDIAEIRRYYVERGINKNNFTRQRAVLYKSWFINDDTDTFQLALDLAEMRVYGLGRGADGYPILQSYQLSNKEKEFILGRLENKY